MAIADTEAAITFTMSKSYLIFKHLIEDFRASSQCCMEWPKYFIWTNEFSVCIAQIEELDCYIRKKNGVSSIKVFKKWCQCNLGEQSTFKLTNQSRKAIFTYLKNNRLQPKDKNETFTFNTDEDLPPKIKVPVYRFSVGTTNDPMLSVPSPTNKGYANKFLYPIHHQRAEILDAINKNRVVAIIGDAIYEKSTQVPQFILEDASEKGFHCRIISCHSRKISAVSDSETVATQRAEQVGSTVAFQVHLESKSSAKTNLLFTTTSFLLRCLMSTSMTELFQGITHLIINDLHETDIYTEFLLIELNKNLGSLSSVNIILLASPMNANIFMKYFRLVKVIELEEMKHEISIIHLEEIITITGRMNDFQQNFDNALDNYILTGKKTSIEYILKAIKTGQLPVNARHSKTLTTPVIAAVRRNRPDHLKSIIELKGNPYLKDSDNKSAFDWADLTQSTECNCILLEANSFSASCSLSEQLFSAYQFSRVDKNGVDHELLFKLICFVNHSSQEGAVLVFLPSYFDIIKQQCFINKGVHAGVLSNIKLYLLHDNISEDDAKKMSEVFPTHRKIVLSTKIGESAFLVQYIRFVIDSGIEVDINNEYCAISSDNMGRRTKLAGSTMSGLCFRLYCKRTANSFSTLQPPSFNIKNLSKFNIYIKLLSQYATVKDYFAISYTTPSAQLTNASLKLLRDIGAMDEDEQILNLGIRLVDIPVDLQLGKVLIFAIALQCLDPVLTIVSALALQEPINLEDYDAYNGRTYISRESLAEGTNSDHMILLRLYQNWQDRRIPDLSLDLPMSQTVLNGLLEAICYLRIQIVGTLRAAGLVHSTGLLSMQSLNTHSHNWALVKACFVGGMYPNICKIDKNSLKIKARAGKKVKLHSKSDICCSNRKNAYKEEMSNQTEWIVFQEDTATPEGDITIKCASIVTPILIALFGGKSKVNHNDAIMEIYTNSLQKQTNYDKTQIIFNVDEWISFLLLSEDAHLLYNLRQTFFHYFEDLLQNCEIEKLQKCQQSLESKSSIIDIISKVTALEESANNLPLPHKVGERPKAFPMGLLSNAPSNNLKLLSNIQYNPFSQPPNQQPSSSNSFNVADLPKSIRRFYVINIESKQEGQCYFAKRLSQDQYNNWQRIIQKIIQFPNDNIIVFFLENLKNFCAVGQMKMDNYDFCLEPIAEVDVPYKLLEDIFYACKGRYHDCLDASEIPPIVGDNFLHYFTGNRK